MNLGKLECPSPWTSVHICSSGSLVRALKETERLRYGGGSGSVPRVLIRLCPPRSSFH